MCLIFLAYEQHSEFRLVVAANRDEQYNRPTSSAHFWPECPHILAGRDLEAGGTWMGVNTSGSFGALTNVRSRQPRLSDPPSRGELVTEFLNKDGACEPYLNHIECTSAKYNGFSLLLYAEEELHYFSNFDDGQRLRLTPGLYGLSNHLLDTPWPKVSQGKQAMGVWLESESDDVDALFRMMSDKGCAADEELPDTGVDKAFERALSALFIESPSYGTRSTSVVLLGYDGVCRFTERTFEPHSNRASTVSFQIDTKR